MKKALTYIAIICLPLLSIAQTGNNRLLEEYLELFSEKEDYSSDENEILETLQYYIENKINLNDTENNNLTDLFFVEQYHINAIRSYIQQYGQMLSINELYLINRIDSTTVSLMLPFVKVEKVKPEQKTSFHDMVKDGKHSIIIGSKTILEKSKGYIDSHTWAVLGDYISNINTNTKTNYYYHFQVIKILVKSYSKALKNKVSTTMVFL